MTTLSRLPDFQKVNKVLRQAHARTDAAETHGMLCGFICAGKKMDGKSWIEPILGGKEKPALGQENRSMLLDIYQISSQKLQGIEFDFQLLLPEDEETLQLRAEALSHWCQGFLIGLDIAGIDIREGVSEESREVFHQFLEISKLDYERIEIDEEDERAFFEVMEYVRMAVLMVYSEIANSGPSGKQYLH